MNTKQPLALNLALSLRDGTYLLSQERDITADELERLHAENEQLRQQLAGRGEPFGWVSMGQIRLTPPTSDPKTYVTVYTAPPDTDALLDQALEALRHGIKAINHFGGAKEAMPLHDSFAAIRKHKGIK